jgi:F0F1-type ATP synthase membrane subunit b/b'
MVTRRWKVALALVFALTVGGLLLTRAALAPAATAAEKEERHPHIRAALEELRESRKDLKEADHDFEGHRKEALVAIDAAIDQLEICLKHDKK